MAGQEAACGGLHAAQPPTRAAPRCSKPFAKPGGWLAWGLLGVLLSPAVVFLSALLAEGAGYSEAGGKGTVDAISQIIQLDGPTFAALFSTTGEGGAEGQALGGETG